MTILDISSNNIAAIPDKVYDSLPRNLTDIFMNDIKLEDFHNLQNLDLSYNAMTYVRSVTTHTLITLYLAHNQIAQLSNGFLEGAVQL